ncbi:MAG: HEAT repeat domain-containing protein [Planctomycetota bacterium]
MRITDALLEPSSASTARDKGEPSVFRTALKTQQTFLVEEPAEDTGAVAAQRGVLILTNASQRPHATPVYEPGAHTEPSPRPQELDRWIDSLFARSADLIFEDGRESAFSRGLAETVRRYGVQAMEYIFVVFARNRISVELASETLRCLGRLRAPKTRAFRRWLLEKGLRHRAPLVRDSAVLGLDSMNDPRAADALEGAASVEPIVELQSEMRGLAREFKSQL